MNDKLERIWKETVVDCGTIPVFSWRDWGKPEKICQHSECPSKAQTVNILNMKLVTAMPTCSVKLLPHKLTYY
jgi:hypothetical protein